MITKTGIRILGFVGMLILILSFSNTAIAQNAPPVADAGADQDMIVYDSIVLEGSGSDPDNNAILGWRWTVETAPAGESPYISDTGIDDPIFEPRVAGLYVLSLIVYDGLEWSEPDFVNINVRDIIEPVAVAEADVTIGPAPLTVQFDGSLSTVDPEFGPLTYQWDFDDGSPGSFEVSPSHTFDPTGLFEVTLTVQDSIDQFNRATIEITVCGGGINCPPAADAGEDTSTLVDEPIRMDGTANDPDGDTIASWSWTVEQEPSLGAAFLGDADLPNALFRGSEAGEYVLALVVNDGTNDSQPDRVTITVSDNLPPTAVAIADVTSGPAPLTVNFDGTGSSDPEGRPLAFRWFFGDASPESFEANPIHIYEFPGTYEAILSVFDDRGQIAEDSITITVTEPTSDTPQEMIGDLIGDVQEYIDTGSLTSAQGRRLIRYLNRALTRLNNDRLRLAEARLNQFIRTVNRFVRRGVLTEDEGQALTDAANEIIEAI